MVVVRVGIDPALPCPALPDRSGSVGREGEEVTRRTGRDDIGRVAGGQGNGPAGTDEPLDLVVAEQMADQAPRLGAGAAALAAAEPAAGPAAMAAPAALPAARAD